MRDHTDESRSDDTERGEEGRKGVQSNEREALLCKSSISSGDEYFEAKTNSGSSGESKALN